MILKTKTTETPESNVLISLTGSTISLSAINGTNALLGFKADDFLTGKVSLQSRIHADDQDIADELFSSKIKPASSAFNIRLRHADGRIRCVKGHYSKEIDKTGNGVTLELRLQEAKSLWQPQGNQTMMANFKAMMENTDDYIYFKDRNHVFTGASQTLVAITDPSEHWTDLIGKTDYDVFPEKYADIYYRLEKQVFAGIHIAYEIQETLDNEGNKGWVDNRKYPLRDEHGEIVGLFGIARDITSRINSELYEKFYNEVLGLLAEKEPLLHILEAIVRGVERLHPAMLCSILLLDTEGKHLLSGFAPSLPDFYNAAINGIEIGVGVGSCGTAAFTGKRVLVDDIQNHPYWLPYNEIATRAGLGACWSQPIYSSTGKVLGTFAIYHHKTHTPTKSDITLIEQSARLAGMAIERKQTDDALVRSETKFRTLFDSTGDAVLMLNEKGFFDCNQAALKLFGLQSIEELQTYHPAGLSPPTQLCGTDSMTLAKHYIDTAMQKDSARFEWIHKRADSDKTFVADILLSTMMLDDKVVLQTTIRDISDRKKAELEKQASEDKLMAFYALDIVGLTITSPEKGWIRINDCLCKMLEYSEQELLGMTWAQLTHPEDLAADNEQFAKLLVNEIDGYSLEKRFISRTGKVVFTQLVVRCVRKKNGDVDYVVAMVEDVTERKKLEEKVRQLAFYDALTKLPNRRLLDDRLNQIMSSSKRSGCYGALMFLDLDNFKPLNDTHGHVMGDLLLIEVANRLKHCVRENDTVARFGGDEFVVLLGDLNENKTESTAQATLVAEKIRATLSDPYLLKVISDAKPESIVEHHCTASIGVVLFINHEASQNDIMKWADNAMYEAKDAGRNLIRIHNSKNE